MPLACTHGLLRTLNAWNRSTGGLYDLIQASFDYGILPAETAVIARSAAERIKLRLKRTVEDIIEIGRELTTVKAELPHGQFLPWIEAEFEMTAWTANKFMNAAERFGGKNEIITYFKPTILYMLAAPSTPDSVIQQALDKAENGDRVTVADVKDWKAEYEQGMQWAIGDWYNSIPWGDKEAACQEVGLSYTTARQCASICAAFPIVSRANNLGFKHHELLAVQSLTDSQRAELLEKASNNPKEWTVARLRHERDRYSWPELGITAWPRLIRTGLTEEQKRSHARALNLARRHLTQEQRRSLIQAELKDRPQVSDRTIARELGVTHPTVATTRKEMEEKGELVKFTSSLGADGKERPRQVERKPLPGCRRYLAAIPPPRACVYAQRRPADFLLRCPKNTPFFLNCPASVP